MKLRNVIFGFFTLLVLILTACQSKETDANLSLDDISKASMVYDESDTLSVKKEVSIQYYDSISTFSQTMVDSLKLDSKTINLLDTMIFPDRFGAIFSEKWYSKSPKDSLIFMRWVFQSELKAKNALFNWLDCFGTKCRSIPLGTETYFSKRGTLILCNQKELIFIETALKINESNWLKLIQGSRKQKAWSYFFFQQPNRKISWKMIDENGEWLNYDQKVD